MTTTAGTRGSMGHRSRHSADFSAKLLRKTHAIAQLRKDCVQHLLDAIEKINAIDTVAAATDNPWVAKEHASAALAKMQRILDAAERNPMEY